MAPFMMSIPADKSHEILSSVTGLLQDTGGVIMCVRVYLWGETQMSYPDTERETSAPAQSLAWETLQRENTDTHTLKHTH